ncbi:MAG TPA: IMP dehydrogenase, partial [Gemmatimonadaceae bacterium]|nr:IMP dehydrogenase [Gemmatimonadaceae bacterium]
MATTTRSSDGPATPSTPESGLSRTGPQGSNGAAPTVRIRQDIALTFDDVLLAPRHSLVHPKNVDTATWFTRGIPLNVPLVSAAMDTVT